MNENLFGFIGSGNMGGALATAIAKKYSASSPLISDADTKKAEKLADKISATASSNDYIASNCKYIFLAVKPQVMDKVMSPVGIAFVNSAFRIALAVLLLPFLKQVYECGNVYHYGMLGLRVYDD